MGGGEELHAGGDLARRADRDRHHVEHHAAEVDEGPGADADPRAVLEVERGPDVDTVADAPQQLGEDPVALGLLGGRAAVEAVEQVLRAGEVGRHLRVGAVVELAAQHPVLHQSHGTEPTA